MKRTGLAAFSLALGAVPFAFAFIRAFETGGRDLRYISVALGGLFGALAAVRIARRSRSIAKPGLAFAAGVFAAAALFSIATAWWLGTMLGPGVFVVGAGFAFCFALSSVVHALARPA